MSEEVEKCSYVHAGANIVAEKSVCASAFTAWEKVKLHSPMVSSTITLLQGKLGHHTVMVGNHATVSTNSRLSFQNGL